MQSQGALLVVSLYMVAVAFGESDSTWNYIRSDAMFGPSAWGMNFPECALDRNSPIDIVTEDAVRQEAQRWTLTGWDSPTTWTVYDKNYTMEFGLNAAGSIRTSGGDLGNYDMIQFHFHWGSSNTAGGEHTLNGAEFPLEVHFVHKRSDFATIGAAVESEEDDALAAVGFFFTIQAEDNVELNTMLAGVNAARNTGTFETSGFNLNALDDFTGDAINGNFYRYYGGLTTPGCNQIVKWTVFETPIGISAAQMTTLRSGTPNSYGTEYYRPVQAVGSRLVVLYDTNYQPFRRGGRRRPNRGGRRNRNRNRNRNGRRNRFNRNRFNRNRFNRNRFNRNRFNRNRFGQ
ncbi:carbonic anhydrase-like [Watersipora subatra]|uniref:carbonic anhydrase-like n=1 Tax=Watersipora subatra TaxID=2589382 RepID=UPI00355C2BE1